jgi:hypothetical protein
LWRAKSKRGASRRDLNSHEGAVPKLPDPSQIPNCISGRAKICGEILKIGNSLER